MKIVIMNNAHFHLVLNHFPVIFLFIGLLIIIGGFFFRSEIIKRTAYTVFVLGSLFTIPAFLTGEGAEEVIENLNGVSKILILPHEERAETFAFYPTYQELVQLGLFMLVLKAISIRIFQEFHDASVG